MKRTYISDPKKLLLHVADFFEKHPERWTKGESARDKDGVGVDMSADSAHRFCTLGALERFGNLPAAADAATTLNAEMDRGIAHWNDTRRSVRPIIKALRKAAGAL